MKRSGLLFVLLAAITTTTCNSRTDNRDYHDSIETIRVADSLLKAIPDTLSKDGMLDSGRISDSLKKDRLPE
jgi:hypothetical protein